MDLLVSDALSSLQYPIGAASQQLFGQMLTHRFRFISRSLARAPDYF